MRRAIAAVCVACLWTAHGAGMSAPFGVRLGEKLLDAQSTLTPDILEQSILTNGVRGLHFDNIAWHGAERFEDVGLSRPLMGVSSARVGVDQNGIAYEFNVCGSFRRGLTRRESLQKIEALRKLADDSYVFRFFCQISPFDYINISKLVGEGIDKAKSLITAAESIADGIIP